MSESNNQANRAYVQSNPEDADPPYAAVACDVAIQTAKPKAVEVVMNLEVGQEEGNRELLVLCLALMISCLGIDGCTGHDRDSPAH